jgi:hypothetical protein
LQLDFQDTVRAISSRLDLAKQNEDYAARADHDNSGLASATAYHPNGAFVFVALETSRQDAILDAQGRRELFTIDVGRARSCAIELANPWKRFHGCRSFDAPVSLREAIPARNTVCEGLLSSK